MTGVQSSTAFSDALAGIRIKVKQPKLELVHIWDVDIADRNLTHANTMLCSFFFFLFLRSNTGLSEMQNQKAI